MNERTTSQNESSDLTRREVEVLTHQLGQAVETIRSLLNSTERLGIAGGTAILVVFGLAGGNRDAGLMVLPLIIFALMFVGLDNWTEVSALGGYRRYLEERINSVIGVEDGGVINGTGSSTSPSDRPTGVESLSWELRVAPALRHGGPCSLAIVFLCMGALGLAIVAASIVLWRESGWFLLAFIPVVLLLLTWLLVAYGDMRSAWGRAYEQASGCPPPAFKQSPTSPQGGRVNVAIARMKFWEAP